MRIIRQINNFRIIEIIDEESSAEDLKGDCFDPNVNPNICERDLKEQEILFEREVDANGVFGYVLEEWDPEIGIGWVCVDSCFGFIGEYCDNNKHYIIDEYLYTIKQKGGEL